MAKQDFMALMRQKTAGLTPSLLLAETDIKRQLLVLEPLRELIPPLTPEELSQLEQNVLSHGVKDPLTIWETTAAAAGLEPSEAPAFVLIDGHNRYQLIQQYGLDFRINLVQFASLEAVKDYMINYQLGRRNLTAQQASYLRGMRYLGQKSARGSNLSADGPQLNVAASLASEYGVSDRTIKRDGEYAAGLQKLTPELKQAVLSGSQKLPKAALNTLGKSDRLAPLAAGELASLTGLPPVSSPSGEFAGGQAANPVEGLKQQIRHLASGKLTGRDCAKLLKKVDELMQLMGSK